MGVMRRFDAEADPGVRRGRRSAVSANPAAVAERLAAGGVAFAVCVWLALAGGGHDVVDRQQLGLAIWWALALGLAFALLPRARLAPSSRAAAAALAVLAVIAAVGAITGESAGAALEELARVIAHAGLLAAVWLGLGPRTWRAAAVGIGLAAIVIVVVALVARLRLGVGPEVDPALIIRRLAYPLGYWNALAAWAVAAFAIALAWSAHLRHPGLRGASLAVLPACGLTLYLTYSRGGLAALAIALAVCVGVAGHRVTVLAHGVAGLAATLVVVAVAREFAPAAEGGGEGGWLVVAAIVAAGAALSLFAQLTRRSRLDRRRLEGAAVAAAGWVAAGALAVGLVGALAGSLAAGPEAVAVPTDRGVHEAEPAARLVSLDDGRGALWGSALDAFWDEPVTGTGGGTFDLWWARGEHAVTGVDDAHSLYLETLAELGLPGLLALIALLVALWVAAVSARRRLVRSLDVGAAAGLLAAAAAFCFQAGVDWLWEFPALVALALGGLAVVGAAGASPRRPRRRALARLPLVAVAIVAGASQVPGIVSEERLRAARGAFAAGLSDRALELADDAARARPWAAEPVALRAELLLASGRPEAARGAVRDAIAREPTSWRHRLLAARVALAGSDRRAAAEALAALAALRPSARDAVDRLRRIELDRRGRRHGEAR